MPFREKMKKAFGGKKSGDNSPSDPATPKIPGIEYYKPHEVPKSKYRGKWDQNHQDKLHSFSFADAFKSRRNSGTSAYSPSGTKAQSRRASYLSRKSLKSEVDDKSLRRKSTNPARVPEDVGETGDVTNVGLSRPTTAGAEATSTNDLHHERTITQNGPSNELPFTADELTQAMSAAKLEDKAF